MIEKLRLRELMIIHKKFLGKLYVENKLQCQTTISAATNGQLRVLIFVLNSIASGQIPIRSEEKPFINSGKAKILHQHFFKAQKAKTLLKADRSEKLEVLMKFCAIFKTLLYYLFHESVKK